MDKYEYILQQILLGRANKIIRQVGYITRMGDRSSYRDLLWTLEGKTPLGRPKCRW